MADTEEKRDKKEKKQPKPGKAPAEAPGAPAPPAEPAPRPRLLEHYEQHVRSKLQQQFGYTNVHEIPKLLKIVLNVGMGDAPKNPKALEAAVAGLGAIAGRKAHGTPAKDAIADFHLRGEQPV